MQLGANKNNKHKRKKTKKPKKHIKITIQIRPSTTSDINYKTKRK